MKLLSIWNLVILLTLSTACFCWQYNNPFKTLQANVNQQIYWFDQKYDHVDYYATEQKNTWKQRYYVYDQYFDPKNGPVILYICGEAQCHGISDTSYTAKIAKQTSALVLSLQHRYYGKSLPFLEKSFQIQNLKLLTAQQALSDLAYFIGQITNLKLHRVSNTSKWITIGGSYPGALSAWFRSKYPHLTVGAIASSGVVLAVQNYRDFDQQIYLSSQKSGNYCTEAILKVTQYAEDQVLSDNKFTFQSMFKAQRLTSREFMFYWSDVIVFYIQYGKRVQFCNSVKDKTTEEVFQIVKQAALKVSPVDYGAYYLKNSTFAYQDGRGARSWIYQSCTQFSYFQTYSKEHPMRSKMLTIDFYRTWCEDIFGNGIWPYVDRVNNQFGGLNIIADNLFMTNGDEDPWKWASLQSTKKNSKIISKVINCDNCAHCSDLHAPTKTDPSSLVSVRSQQMASIKTWLN